jgi:hypothetical protein
MERTLPSSINYQDVLPLSVPAIARRRRFYPQNGTSFNSGGSREIRIEIASVNSLLDAQHSYLEFEFVNTNALQTLGLDAGGGALFFDTVRVEQGGRVLSELQGYNRLHASIIDPVQVSVNGKTSESLTQGQRGYNGGAGAAGAVAPAAAGLAGDSYSNNKHNINTQVPNAAAGAEVPYRVTMPITSGLFTQDKLIPLPLVRQDAPITLSLLLTAPENLGVWSAAPNPTDIRIQKISYTAQLIEVGRDVIEQIRQTQTMMGGQLALSGQDWEHTQGLLPGASTGEHVVRMPSRKRSINSLFWIAQSDDITNGAGGMALDNIYNMSFAGCANVDSYQLKVGSVVYPPTPINAFGNSAAAGALASRVRSESTLELAKAFGTLGFVNPTGRLNTITYGTNTAGMGDGDNGNGAGATIAPASNTVQCFCPFGLDTTSFQHEALEAGVDTQTLSQESNLILNINAAGSGVENKNVHIWIIYDQHYYFNANGMVTFSN